MIVDFFIAGDHEAGKALVHDILAEHGFAVEAVAPDGSWTIGRGSTTVTVLLGAMAGKKQRLVYTVSFFSHEGNLVARIAQQSGAGMMGGAIGMSRSRSVLTSLATAMQTRLTESQLFLGTVTA
ncbi:hypothetical protein [Homoserinibacter sp. GY 40078]|uniref:hypothetical protein n=1 Tax=Homoserinibacter sp. GY 40078 TaxID=2603275 RepID=UPI0011CBB168|nr:hypothetical protein [Homoserinibacter sp. GY 40078]TXK18603.1 hypothetical protein FVQ89_01230 [Homoserinibacter sp. GY 40078]